MWKRYVILASHVEWPKAEPYPMVFTPLYRFLTVPGPTCRWILYSGYQELKGVTILFLLSWTDFLKCLILFPAGSRIMLDM